MKAIILTVVVVAMLATSVFAYWEATPTEGGGYRVDSYDQHYGSNM